ncbi:hypothetical protein A33M_1009 [Rhodovulum sp. PH10]|uniref:hypothetical protein n=1 Tax=Rhodovulum sp. PH10 TaxID=1187851 RepID=UPI00027C1EDB|nr:hypothetical protein [Rhodovulum sp. PH10]EJW09732.1 hypothetical protein A33M_1009 [Rhodovulum sp. PH10]
MLLAAGQNPAEAHRLKVFATVEDGAITGYAFFIGGGRPEGVDFIVKNGSGTAVHRGKTDDEGGFRWRPDHAEDYSVTVDAGDGHFAAAEILADRLAGQLSAEPATATPQATAPAPAFVVPAQPGPAEAAACAPLDRDALAKLVQASVDRAVAREIRPLLEAYDQADGRVRLNDVMGGVGMIVGLAGAGLWAVSRRRRPVPDDPAGPPGERRDPPA